MKKLLTLLLCAVLLLTACGDEKPVAKNSNPVSAPPTAAQQSQADSSALLKKDSAIRAAPAEEKRVLLDGDVKDLKDVVSPAPVGRNAAAPPQPASEADESSIGKNGFSDVAALDGTIKLDIRYATTDNFTQSKIYDCPRCLLRPDAAKAIAKAHKALQKKGLGLKMYDCYRPRPYQQRLWDKVPNPDYVTPPAKGSMHSRGAAVDLTIVDKDGKELDMGTPYDFFGKEAHTDNTNLPAQVLANRRLLRETLEAVGFEGIRTEWWHFSFRGKNYPLADYMWPCKE